MLEHDLAGAGRILGMPVPEGLLDVTDAMSLWLKKLAVDPTLQPWLARAMVLREAGVMVGHIGFHTAPGEEYLRPYAPGGVEFGFTVFSPFLRQGFAREASKALMGWAHQVHGVTSFVLSIRPDNVASQALAAGLGFVRIGSHIDDVDGLEDVLVHILGQPTTSPVSLRFPSSLSTRRLLLRRLQRADAQALCAYRSLPEVARYQSWKTFGPDDAARLLDDQQDRDIGIPGTWLQVAIVEAGTGQLIGDCGLHCLADEPRQFEIGVTLAPSRQGQGYATEALDCLVHYLFTALSARRIFATTDALNDPAAALFRRLGFRQEAHHIEHRAFKGTWTSEFVFALLAREWEMEKGSEKGARK